MPKKTSWDFYLPTSGDRLVREQRIADLYDKGQWLECYLEAQANAKAHPWSVKGRISEMALLGDSAEVFVGPERRRRKAAAIRQLQRLGKGRIWSLI